jgi:hypothetical protein
LGKPYFYDKKDSTIGKSLIQKIAKDEMIWLWLCKKG